LRRSWRRASPRVRGRHVGAVLTATPPGRAVSGAEPRCHAARRRPGSSGATACSACSGDREASGTHAAHRDPAGASRSPAARRRPTPPSTGRTSGPYRPARAHSAVDARESRGPASRCRRGAARQGRLASLAAQPLRRVPPLVRGRRPGARRSFCLQAAAEVQAPAKYQPPNPPARPVRSLRRRTIGILAAQRVDAGEHEHEHRVLISARAITRAQSRCTRPTSMLLTRPTDEESVGLATRLRRDGPSPAIPVQRRIGGKSKPQRR
jgi:hypothetical protein